MTNPKRTIMLVLLFMVIGIAAVTTNVVISGSTSIAKNPDDFNVYFSNVLVNGTQDLSLVRNDKTLVFNKDFSALNDKIGITYDVTNGSKDYDAQVSINCTPSTEYLTITNEFDTDINLAARSTKTGVLTVTLSKTNIGADITEEISCTISANAVERTSQVTSTIANPLNPYYIGREVAIGEEKFNIISSDETTVTMLAQYNISESTYKQTDEQMSTAFVGGGWEYTPGPNDIEIQNYDSEIKILLNNYVSYLETEYDVVATGNLITGKKLGDLGCVVPSDYGWGDAEYGDYTCKGSVHSEWLINGQHWWTRSVNSEHSLYVWLLTAEGIFSDSEYYFGSGIRPVITISKENLERIDDIIYFTIYGERYMAYKGMTWEEWCDSEFNVIGYYVEDGYVYSDNGYYFWDYLSYVRANEIIEPREYSRAGTDPV